MQPLASQLCSRLALLSLQKQSAVEAWQQATCRAGPLSRSASTAAAAADRTRNSDPAHQQLEVVSFLRLNNLQDNPGAVHQKRRIGRGIGSSKGKTSGRGHKGQKARAGGNIHPTFEGGQTKLYKLLPKRGFNNARHATPMLPINLGTIQNYIDMGRLTDTTTNNNGTLVITLHDMQRAGLFKPNGVKHGVKLLADGHEKLKQPVQIFVSRASQTAIKAVEAIEGGKVVTEHYNQLALRTLLRPQKFVDRPSLPRRARPPPKLQPYYTSWKNRGYLNPAVQMREWFHHKKKQQKQQDGVDELEEKFERILAQKRQEKDEQDEEKSTKED